MKSKTIFFFLALFLLIENYKCVNLEEAKKNPTKAYVLTELNGNQVSDNGVRIGPVDLRYETEAKMKKYGFNQTIIDKLKPYIGLSGVKAEEALKAKPLVLDEKELDTISNQMKNFYLPKIKILPTRIRNDQRLRDLIKKADKNEWPEFLIQTDQLRKQLNVNY